MKFQPEILLLIVLIFFFLSGCAEKLIKNDGVLKTGFFKKESNTKDTTKNLEPNNIIGSDGQIYQQVPEGVSTRTIDERLQTASNGIGWDSTALLPKEESGFDNMSPIEFAKGENFLEPQAMIGSVVDSNRNANLQLRKDPYIPARTVSPFLQSTISPDVTRRTLGI